ncbi:MAG: thrombospondin type 3 repeat-containing protein [Myxococcota bacterium]
MVGFRGHWIRGVAAGAFCLGIAASAQAGDLTSPSYTLRGAHEASLASGALTASGPRFSGGSVSVGQADAVGFSRAAGGLDTLAPGFWPLALGGFPNHDVDGDGIPSWLDDDDDGDRLADAIERNTGLFVSASDPGTSSVLADTDGDFYRDRFEIQVGTDPTSAASAPSALAVPVGRVAAWVSVAAVLLGAAWVSRSGGRRRLA